ncbi:MAG: cupin-like domain-containing protein [Gammaproteobacteria bacterium]|nr:cupin-like domain-containing protein [Gammaproteobacteria bacterium]
MGDKSNFIKRRSKIPLNEFTETYIDGLGKPVVITDAMENWKAMTKWSFDFFKTHYGADTVYPRYKIKNTGKSVEIEVKMADYIDYILSPESSGLKNLEKKQALYPLYLYTYMPFSYRTELLDDFDDVYFVESWNKFIPRSTTTDFQSGWILIGPKGTVTPLHIDYMDTHTWMGQITGRKRCIFFSPEDEPFLYDGKVDPLDPDLDKYPLFAKATPYEVFLDIGELLFIPRNWWHYVVALEKSITLSCSLINASNFQAYLKRIREHLKPSN